MWVLPITADKIFKKYVMKFCIITDIDETIPHGLGRYVTNLIDIFSIPSNYVYNVFNLTEDDLDFINSNFDFVSIQIGILKRNQIQVVNTISKIRIPKIATIHSVVAEELYWLSHCFENYFPKVKTDFNVISHSSYVNLLSMMDLLIFYTNHDKNIFNKHYDISVEKVVISPSIEYIIQNRYSDVIKTEKSLGYLGRLDYRKGMLASLNSMEFLKDYNMNMYGLLTNQHDMVILDYFLKKCPNIKFHSTLKNRYDYFTKTSIFLGNSLYEPFGFSHVENLFNFVVPIIGKGTGTHEVFGEDYPFAVEDSVPQLLEMIHTISNMESSDLYDILKRTQQNLSHLTDASFSEKYSNVIKSVI